MAQHLLAIDQGTTSTRAILYDPAFRPISSAQIALQQHYPQDGWVEHAPRTSSPTRSRCRAWR